MQLKQTINLALLLLNISGCKAMELQKYNLHNQKKLILITAIVRELTTPNTNALSIEEKRKLINRKKTTIRYRKNTIKQLNDNLVLNKNIGNPTVRIKQLENEIQQLENEISLLKQ